MPDEELRAAVREFLDAVEREEIALTPWTREKIKRLRELMEQGSVEDIDRWR